MPLAAAAYTAVATAALALATAALALATAALALATAALATAALAALAATLAAEAAPARYLLFRPLRPMHRRSERTELHSLAQFSVELRLQPGVLHLVERARHWKAPDSDLL